MKKYTNASPEFHDELDIVDTSTPDNGDNISLADRQNFDNSLILAERVGILSKLTTTEKKSLVKAINELVSNKVGTDAVIDVQHGGTGATTADAVVQNVFASFSGSGFHNSLYRGKNLGKEITTEQWGAIGSGSFTDMYVGDYWTLNDRVYRIAGFDYWLKHGDTECTEHHIVIVPDACLFNAKMNDSDVTTGAYVGSKMYTEYLVPAKATINMDFGSTHILSHREYLSNAMNTTSGFPYESSCSWYDSTVELMNERMVYGANAFHNVGANGAVPKNHTIDKSQLPLFVLEPSRICTRVSWWLRDAASAAFFAYVGGYGDCGAYHASNANGVRPVFGIKA